MEFLHIRNIYHMRVILNIILLKNYVFINYDNSLEKVVPPSEMKFVSGLQLSERHYHDLQHYVCKPLSKFSTVWTSYYMFHGETATYFVVFFAGSLVRHFGHFTWSGASPKYPSSASTCSPSSSSPISPMRKIIRSLYFPGSKGPLIQQISPVKIFNATSYRRPEPLNLLL